MVYAQSGSPRPLAVPGIAFLQDLGDRDGHGPKRSRLARTPHRVDRHPFLHTDEGREPPHMMEFFAAAFVIVAVTFGPMLAWLLLHMAGDAG
jgi:hypothetical protein